MNRDIHTTEQLGVLVYELGNMQMPFSVTIRLGRKRTDNQNDLAWKWAREIAAHFGDRTANEVHAENKLHHGVPIRRETDDEFRRVYDERIKPLTYEAKLALMAPPIDLPVTRDFKRAEMSRFMDEVRAYWMREGVALTDPEARKYEGAS